MLLRPGLHNLLRAVERVLVDDPQALYEHFGFPAFQQPDIGPILDDPAQANSGEVLSVPVADALVQKEFAQPLAPKALVNTLLIN